MKTVLKALLVSAALQLCLAPLAYAGDDDKDTPKAETGTTGAPGDAKAPEAGAPEDAGKDDSDEDAGDQDDSGKGNDKSSSDKDQSGGPGENNERKGSVRLKDLIANGFLIRTTVFVPADAVTRQTGQVSTDAMVLTLQKEAAIAVCYYTFKAYVKGGKGLMKIPSCTVFD